jgi:hypothetical protein
MLGNEQKGIRHEVVYSICRYQKELARIWMKAQKMAGRAAKQSENARAIAANLEMMKAELEKMRKAERERSPNNPSSRRE